MSHTLKYIAGLVLAFSLAGLGPAEAWSAPKTQEAILEDTLPRDRFVQVYRDGPQRFIASLHLQPHVLQGRFVGYQITGFEPNSPMKGGQYIRKGDVVISVNGQSLEKPDQFMKAWQAMRTAKAIEVRVQRDTRTFTVRWHIAP